MKNYSYSEAVSLLTSQEKFHIKLGLERVSELLNYFGNPQDKIKCIHVAGTNGKGSTCAMLASVLSEAGYKTGLYTSPHIVEYTERIKINGEEISQQDFAEVIYRVLEQAEPQNIVHYNSSELPAFNGDKSVFNREILSYYKKEFQGKNIYHKILGEINFFDAGIRKTIHVNSTEDLRLIIKLDELIKNGKYVKTETSYKERVDGIVKFHTLLTKINLNNSLKNLEIKIGEDKRGNKFYFYKSKSLDTLPEKTGVIEASNFIISNSNKVLNPKEQSSGTLPGKTGVTEASISIIPNQNTVFNPIYPKIKIPATEFEILTVAAFVYFYEKNVDFALIETGLGGRLDATNTIKKPLMSIITDIDLDHTTRLGNTLSEIAFEKAGIIKNKTPVITLKDNNGLDVIQKKASDSSSEIILTDPDKTGFKTGLKGIWQNRNLSLVEEAVNLLKSKMINIPNSALQKGLQNTEWAGRFQYIEEENLIIDAAHNPLAAKALKESLDKYFPDSRRIFIYSSLNVKDYKSVISLLFRKNDTIILTKTPSPACEAPENIQNCLGNLSEVYLTQNVTEALELSKKLARKEDLLIFTGSIYTIGELFSIRQHYKTSYSIPNTKC